MLPEIIAITAFSSCLTLPFDNLRVQKSLKTGKVGFTQLYAGCGIVASRSAIFFGVRHLLVNQNDRFLVAGAIAAALVSPLDQLLVRLQIQEQTAWEAFQTVQKDGLHELFRGWRATMAKYFLLVLPGYVFGENFELGKPVNEIHIGLLAAGSLLAYPFEIIRTNVHKDFKYGGAKDCFVQEFSNLKIFGLYSGFSFFLLRNLTFVASCFAISKIYGIDKQNVISILN